MASRTKIKICGVRDVSTARVAAEGGADFIGLVFVPRSPRHVTDEQAMEIADSLDTSVAAVGVFKDTPPSEIERLAEAVGLAAVQLHGDYTPEDVRRLAPIQVIGAISFEEGFEPVLRAWIEARKDLWNLMAVMVDTPDPTRLGGGTGKTFDWDRLRKTLDRVGPGSPLVLAGGLTAENVQQAIQVVHPWAVDVSSGVERERGVKDHGKIQAFCEAVRSAALGSEVQ